MPYFTPSASRYRTRMRRSRGGRRKLARRGYRSSRYSRPMTPGKVRRIVDAELKTRDLGVGPVDLPSLTGFVTQISNIGQGDTDLQRTGNWIKPVTWMGTIVLQGNVLDVVNQTVTYRVGAVVWKENQGVNALTLAKLMQDTSAPLQQYRVQNKGQFKILWSRTGILSTNDTNPNFQVVHKFYVKPNLKVLYDGGGFKNNHLFIFAYSDIPAANNPPQFSFDTRIRFTDS